MADSRVKRTGEEFREQAERIGIQRMGIRRCTICGQWVSFDFVGGEVYFNGACGCADFFAPRKLSWDHVADLYNEQTQPGTIAQFDELWGFAPWMEEG
jgi:hypothetical protein